MKFFYCASGPEGDPVLLISPSIVEADIQDIKRNARLKTFARGDIIPGVDGLVFSIDADIKNLLEIDLKRFFSKKVSALQNARVISRASANTARQILHSK